MPRRRRLASSEPVRSSGVSGSAFGRPGRRERRRSAAQRRHRLHRRARQPASAPPSGRRPAAAARGEARPCCRSAPRRGAALEEAPGDLLRPAAAVERREVEPGDAGVEGGGERPEPRRLADAASRARRSRSRGRRSRCRSSRASRAACPSPLPARLRPAGRLAARRCPAASPHARPAARSSARRRPSWTAVSVGLAWPEVGSTAVETTKSPGVPKTRQRPSTTPCPALGGHADRADLVRAVPGVREHHRRPGLGIGLVESSVARRLRASQASSAAWARSDRGGVGRRAKRRSILSRRWPSRSRAVARASAGCPGRAAARHGTRARSAGRGSGGRSRAAASSRHGSSRGRRARSRGCAAGRARRCARCAAAPVGRRADVLQPHRLGDQPPPERRQREREEDRGRAARSGARRWRSAAPPARRRRWRAVRRPASPRTGTRRRRT